MAYYPPVSPYTAGFSGKCPRCGQGALFDGYLALKKDCDICKLDFEKADSGDGPAVFVIFIVGFLAVVLAVIARYVWYAPIFVAFLVSSVAAIAMIFALLPPLKATMIALQFKHKAAQAVLGDSDPDQGGLEK